MAPLSTRNVGASPTVIIQDNGVTCVDFGSLQAGQSVEGLGTVHPDLDIESQGDAVVIKEGEFPSAYGSPNNGPSTINKEVGTGGFSDIAKLHNYTFSFAPDLSISYFSIRMLDYGDLNRARATEHSVALVAYDINNNVVNSSTLSFTSTADPNPTSGSAGNLQVTGDATAALGQPGNFSFDIFGSGITQLEFQFSSNIGEGSSDPNIGFTALCFQVEEQIPDFPTDATCVDFNILAPGESVEGLGTVHPNLNISSVGDVIAVTDGAGPAAYGAPNDENSVRNYGLGTLGGFSAIDKVHDYNFTFAPDVTVDFFTVKMLDYGDLNRARASTHEVTLVAYNDSGVTVDADTLSFTSDGTGLPTNGSAGNLQLTGDATANEGMPGNYTFIVAGTGISRLEIQFSSDVGDTATDPNLGLAVLCFELEQTPPPIIPPNAVCANFSDLPLGASVEGLGVVLPELNIISNGDVIAIAEGTGPAAYGGPNNENSIRNNGVAPLGGFSAIDKVHDYNFAFAPNVTVNYFTVQMLDYGDLNRERATEHEVILVAYDTLDAIVDSAILSFTSDGTVLPTSGSAGNLQITGDATADPGMPGNYTFTVLGSGITRLEVQFSSDVGNVATDRNFGFANLCFVPETPPPTDNPQTCEDLGYTTIAEDTWQEHVIDGMDPITLGYARPSAADYAIVNTGWEWTGNPNQEQVTEMHSVVTPFGTVTSQDYGDEELAGQILWFGAPQGAFDQPSLQVTIDYAGDGSDPGSHRSHGLIAWCDNPNIEPPTPNEPLTCEDIGLEPVASADWSQHVIRNMTPVTDNFAQPDDANYVIVNTAWAWSGLPDQRQVTEKHSVDTPLGTAVSDDYGDEELDGELIWHDVLQGAFGAGNLPVTIDYAGDGSDPGSHFSKGLVNWCRDPNAPAASSTLLQPLGDNGAQVEVAYTCSDAAPTLVSATMNGYTVEDGQTLWLVPNDDSFSNTVDGGLTAIYGPAFSLAVTCAAADGAQSTTIVVPDLGG